MRPETSPALALRFRARGAVVVRAWRWWLLPALTGSLGFFLLGQSHPLGLAVQLITATAAGIIYVGKPRRKRVVEIVVDEPGIVLNGSVVAKLEDVTGLSVTSVADRMGVQKLLTSITLRSGATIELVVDSDAHVAELRQALGLALARSASRRFVGHSSLGCLGSLAASIAALIATIWATAVVNFERHLVLWGTVVPSLLIVVPVLFGRMKKVVVTSGEEGIFIKRVMGSRFVRYDEITALEVVFGKVVRMGTGRTIYNFELASSEDAHAMITDIRQRAAMPKVDGDENIGAMLARRDGQSIEAWMELVRKQSSPSDGYRSQQLSEERLWAVLEDPGADPTARVAAAVALRASARGAAPHVRVQLDQRVRVAASATAFPQVRGALEQIADAESDEEIPLRVMRVMK